MEKISSTKSLLAECKTRRLIHKLASSTLTKMETLSKLTSSLQTANNALQEVLSSTAVPAGISLLDVKNELLVSYLQNLVYLILLQIRQHVEGDDAESTSKDTDVAQKLVELRLNLEKGVRPLEGRVKYQMDKAVRAAESADQQIKSKPRPAAEKRKDVEAEDGEEDESDAPSETVEESNLRPNLEAFTQKRPEDRGQTGRRDGQATDGVYRPPRITPTTLPQSFDDRQTRVRKPQRSHLLDDYIDTEISTAPVAQPSIGSTIVAGGRHTKSDKERREEAERTAYEESNFTRLPPMSKKEKARKAARKPVGFGGEELRGIGEGLDHIGRLTARKGGKQSRAEDERGERGSKRRKVGRR